MWEEKINNFFENMSEYDNNNLSLHNAIDFIDVTKERLSFELDDDNNLKITILKYKDNENNEVVDAEGLMYWCHMIFHKELIEELLRLKEKLTILQNTSKQLQNSSKLANNDDAKNDIKDKIEENSTSIEEIELIMNKIDSYRRNTFSSISDLNEVKKLTNDIKIIKEHVE
jgi:hypothetical protein